MEAKEFKYTIGSKVYSQKPVVMGQINQLIEVLKGVNIPAEINVVDIITALGEKLPKAIAVVLHDPDIPLRSKDVNLLASDIEFELTPEQTMEIVEDFFECTPVSLILEKMGKTIEKISQKFMVEMKTTGSTESV
jgi:hypothetical protein